MLHPYDKHIRVLVFALLTVMEADSLLKLAGPETPPCGSIRSWRKPLYLDIKGYMDSERALCPQRKDVQGLLYAQICIQSFLGTSRLQAFYKHGYKHSICPYRAWCATMSGIQLQTRGEPSILGAQELSK